MAFVVDDLVKCRWKGELVLEMLVREVGKAEHYPSVSVIPISEGRLI